MLLFSAPRLKAHDLFSNGLFRGFSKDMSKEDLLAETKLYGELNEEVAKITLFNAMMEPEPDLFSPPLTTKEESTSSQEA